MNTREVAARIAIRLADAGVPDAPFEAELLTRTAARINRAAFYADPPFPVDRCQALQGLVVRRLRREPAAYLLANREFYGLDFHVAPGVLIPRPETEMLVEAALKFLAESPGATVVDAGTGSGCIAVAVAHHAPEANVIATDISPIALRIAEDNAARHSASVTFIECDLLDAIEHADVMLANPPYIPSADIPGLEPEVRDWEPRLALDGGPDGLDLVRRLVNDCGDRLRPRLLAIEVALGQAGDVAQLVEQAGGDADIQPDLAGIDRMVTGRWM